MKVAQITKLMDVIMIILFFLIAETKKKIANFTRILKIIKI